MPIKPENRERYPKNWKEIRAERRRAVGDCCEGCGLENGAWGYRDSEKVFHPKSESVIAVTTDHGETFKCFRIVLTLAHLDHQPENNDPENLRLWCQKCHLDHDREHHKQSRYMTRRAQRQTQELPL